jgi:tetratricopeptide (TPR) repeat protein
MATYNLLGSCECMLQEFDRAIDYFSWATKLAPSDPWLHQNLALAHELKGQLDQADGHWNRYFEMQSRVPTPALPNYRETLRYESLNRLADAFSKKERWNTALTYLNKACQLRPNDTDALERLFHMYNQVKRPEDARRTLKRLRELRPSDPQLELYEIDLREVKTLEDIERMLADIRKTLNKYPNDVRVEEKAVSLVGNVIPLIGRMYDQYSEQLNRVMDQVRRLPNYQVNWHAVHDVMRDLQRELQKLRRIANKCLGLVTSDEHRRIIKELIEHIDKKIEVCQSMGA